MPPLQWPLLCKANSGQMLKRKKFLSEFSYIPLRFGNLFLIFTCTTRTVCQDIFRTFPDIKKKEIKKKAYV